MAYEKTKGGKILNTDTGETGVFRRMKGGYVVFIADKDFKTDYKKKHGTAQEALEQAKQTNKEFNKKYGNCGLYPGNLTKEEYYNQKQEQYKSMEKDVKENIGIYAKGAVKRNIDKNDFTNNTSKFNVSPDVSSKAYDKALNNKINSYKKRKGYTEQSVSIPSDLKEGFAIQKSSYNDESKMSFISTEKGNLELVYNGKRTGTIMRNTLSDKTAIALRDDGRLLSVDEYYQKKDYSSMTRKELAGAIVDDQIKRGVVKKENREIQINARLKGLGSAKPMSKQELLKYFKS